MYILQCSLLLCLVYSTIFLSVLFSVLTKHIVLITFFFFFRQNIRNFRSLLFYSQVHIYRMRGKRWLHGTIGAKILRGNRKKKIKKYRSTKKFKTVEQTRKKNPYLQPLMFSLEITDKLEKTKMKIWSLNEAHPKIENQPPINNEEDGGLQAGYSKIINKGLLCQFT